MRPDNLGDRRPGRCILPGLDRFRSCHRRRNSCCRCNGRHNWRNRRRSLRSRYRSPNRIALGIQTNHLTILNHRMREGFGGRRSYRRRSVGSSSRRSGRSTRRRYGCSCWITTATSRDLRPLRQESGQKSGKPCNIRSPDIGQNIRPVLVGQSRELVIRIQQNI